jgi:hypothetical protein
MKRSVQCCLAFSAMLVGLALTSCKKEEPPPPLPSAAPQPSSAPATVELQPIAEAAVDASVPAAKGATGGAVKRASIAACCAALEQNAASAPEPNATYMKQAAAFCKAQGSANPAAVNVIAGMLRGGGLPASCK